MGDSGENHEVFGTKGTLGVKVRVVWAAYSDELTALNTPSMTGRRGGVGEKKKDQENGAAETRDVDRPPGHVILRRIWARVGGGVGLNPPYFNRNKYCGWEKDVKGNCSFVSSAAVFARLTRQRLTERTCAIADADLSPPRPAA